MKNQMNVGSQEFEITPLSDWIGGEVKGVDLRHDLTGQTAAIISKITFSRHGIVIT